MGGEAAGFRISTGENTILCSVVPRRERCLADGSESPGHSQEWGMCGVTVPELVIRPPGDGSEWVNGSGEGVMIM